MVAKVYTSFLGNIKLVVGGFALDGGRQYDALRVRIFGDTFIKFPICIPVYGRLYFATLFSDEMLAIGL